MEMQNLSPSPDLLHQNLHIYKVASDLYVQYSLRSTGLWDHGQATLSSVRFFIWTMRMISKTKPMYSVKAYEIAGIWPSWPIEMTISYDSI